MCPESHCSDCQKTVHFLLIFLALNLCQDIFLVGNLLPKPLPAPQAGGSCLSHPPLRTGLQTKQLRQELRKAVSNAMTCVNFKLCRSHTEDSGYILQAGRCNPRHNSGAFKATQRWFLWRCLCATPYCAENSGSFQVCSTTFCCASTWKRVKIPELSLWFLGSWKWWAYLCRQEGATCLPLAKFITQELQFYPYPGVTRERKRHLSVLWDVGCPSSRGWLTQSTASPGRAARRPPTTAMSCLQPALVPPCSSSISRTPQHGKGPSAIWKRDKHNSCGFRKYEMKILW